jgi:hypothetical protein
MVLALRCTVEQLAAVHKYAERLPNDLKVLAVKRIVDRPAFNYKKSPIWAKWISDPELTAVLSGKE